MLKTEQAAGFFGINQRRIFQIIETEAAHFIETEAGAAMICLTSLTAALDDETHNNSRPLLNTTSNTDQIKNVSLNLTTNKTALTSSDISANVLTEAGRQN